MSSETPDRVPDDFGSYSSGPRMQPYSAQEIITHCVEHSPHSNRLYHDVQQEVVYLRGYCLICNEGDFDTCRCHPRDYSETNPRETQEENGDPHINFLLGNCDHCYSGGTVGYQCLECFQGTYKTFFYTTVLYPGREILPTRRLVDPFWFGEFHDTAKFHWIVPISDAQVLAHAEHPDFNVDLTAAQSSAFATFVMGRFNEYNDNVSLEPHRNHDVYILGMMTERHLHSLSLR